LRDEQGRDPFSEARCDLPTAFTPTFHKVIADVSASENNRHPLLDALPFLLADWAFVAAGTLSRSIGFYPIRPSAVPQTHLSSGFDA
jgi:hypothetical protein